MANSGKSFSNLHSFYSHWRDRDGFQSNGIGMCWFPAIINYETQTRAVTVASTMTIFRNSGPDDGRIEIKEAGELTADGFHLGFKAEFQDYRFDLRSGALTVAGNSPKMGSYSAMISPQL